jgi:hypothetical protein
MKRENQRFSDRRLASGRGAAKCAGSALASPSVAPLSSAISDRAMEASPFWARVPSRRCGTAMTTEPRDHLHKIEWCFKRDAPNGRFSKGRNRIWMLRTA